VDLSYDWAYAGTVSDAWNSTGRSETNARLLDQIRRYRDRYGLDAVISYARSCEIDSEVVGEMVRSGIPWINFFCDSIGDFASVEDLARRTSLNWFPEHAAIEAYRMVNPSYLCRPYAYNASYLPELARTSPAIHDLGFVGLPTTNRVALLGILSFLGCKCEIRGPDWLPSTRSGAKTSIQKRLMARIRETGFRDLILRAIAWRRIRPQLGGALSDQEFFEFLSQCKITLGLTDAKGSDGKLTSYLKFRDLEMPGYGCCYLTQSNVDIRTYLEPNREVLVFENLWEARDKIRFYRSKPDLITQIGQAGRKRVLSEHVWSARLRELQQALGA
jgi:hypothetical protein